MADASQGAQSLLCIEPLASPHTFDTSSEPYEFLYESLRRQGRIIGGHGVRGTRSASMERTRAGAYSVVGRIAMHPSPATLDLLLPRILGGTESADTFPLAETLPAFGVLIDRVNEQFEYTDCKVNRAMFRGRAASLTGNDPEPIELVLEIVGKTEVTGTTYPALTLGTAANYAPYVFEDASSGLTLNAATRDMLAFELMIDNHLHARFSNSLTATSITPRDRTVALQVLTPYTSDESNLYAQTNLGATGSLVFTNAGMSTTFTFGTLQVPPRSPIVKGKTEIGLELLMTARMSGATKELVITHDSVA